MFTSQGSSPLKAFSCSSSYLACLYVGGQMCVRRPQLALMTAADFHEYRWWIAARLAEMTQEGLPPECVPNAWSCFQLYVDGDLPCRR